MYEFDLLKKILRNIFIYAFEDLISITLKMFLLNFLLVFILWWKDHSFKANNQI